jgi:hypothetical protein
MTSISNELPDEFRDMFFEHSAFNKDGSYKPDDEDELDSQLDAEFFQKCYDKWGKDKEIWPEILNYFMAWVWLDWCQKNLPKPPPPTEEELERFRKHALAIMDKALADKIDENPSTVSKEQKFNRILQSKNPFSKSDEKEEIKEPKYNLNPDGSFMNADQIFEHFISDKVEKSSETKEMLATDFEPPKEASREEDMSYLFGKQQFGRWLRNSYGLWAKDNPYTVLNPKPNSQGIIDDPLFPDNYSGVIVNRITEYYKEKKNV